MCDAGPPPPRQLAGAAQERGWAPGGAALANRGEAGPISSALGRHGRSAHLLPVSARQAGVLQRSGTVGPWRGAAGGK